MSAEVLRRAASLMRERAEAARAGRWFQEGDEVRANWTLVRQVATCHGSIDIGNVANAVHIASWHPAVALAVADSLIAAAAHIESHDCEAHCEPGGCELVLTATRTARAYLGESA